MQLDPENSIKHLRDKGILVDNGKQTIAEIASLNKKTPQQIYLAMKPRKAKNTGIQTLPDNPPPGFGNQSLANICSHYHLNTETIIKILTMENIKAEPDMSIRMIADQNHISPLDVYLVIKAEGRR